MQVLNVQDFGNFELSPMCTLLYRNIFCTICRGVFQTLVEKHFPAPDRRKFFDIFGLSGGSYNEDSNPPTPGSNKRKKGQCLKNFCVDFVSVSFNMCFGRSEEASH